MTRLRAYFERLVSPGYGTCWLCRRPWRFVEPHSVAYSTTRGAFALCELCWNKSDYDTRWRAMYRRHGVRPEWDEINRAMRFRRQEVGR